MLQLYALLLATIQFVCLFRQDLGLNFVLMLDSSGTDLKKDNIYCAIVFENPGQIEQKVICASCRYIKESVAKKSPFLQLSYKIRLTSKEASYALPSRDKLQAKDTTCRGMK